MGLIKRHFENIPYFIPAIYSVTLQRDTSLNKRITITFFFAVFFTTAFAQQPGFSLATNVDIQRNFKKEQLYWAAGHSTQALFHLTPKDGIYVEFAYYSNGRFKNNVTATAKSALTIPQQVNYINSGLMRLKQFTVGWRKYLKGASDAEKNWNLYCYAGFGLLLGRVENTHSAIIDTSVYNIPVRSGKASFKRLTMDLGLGWEIPVGGDFYFYTEGKVWIPTTDYPSKYIFVNNNAPLVAMLGAGFRILF